MSLVDSIDRRTLLVGGGIGVGLVVAYAFWPGGLSSDLAAAKDEQTFGHFIKIARNGRVTVAVPQSETGQGVWTALPQVVADELGAAWETIGVEPAPLTAAYGNTLAAAEGWLKGFGRLRAHRMLGDGRGRITAGSTSVRAFEQPLREAAAVARDMLVGAAADRWGVSEGDCTTGDGFVMNGGRTFTFGELAEEAADRKAPLSPTYRSDSQGRLSGQALPRLDGPAKANGSWRFAADVRLPDMMFASARLAPAGGRIIGLDEDAVRAFPGVHRLERRDDWVAVAADSWIAAERALAAANVRMEAPAGEPDPRSLFDRRLSEAGETIVERGDFAAAARDLKPLATTYFVAPSAHRSIEPLSATARWAHGGAELWSAAQAPGLLRSAAAEAANTSIGNVALYPMPSGEPAGRAFANPAAPIALSLSAAMQRPVQVVLPQHVAQNLGPFGPGAIARMRALIDHDGSPAGLAMDLAGTGGLESSIGQLGGVAGTEPANIGDAIIAPYGFPNLLITSRALTLPFAIGYMRGSPLRETTFFTESFIDELARRRGQEPLAFRMSLLGGNPRLARCFQSVAEIAGWDGGGPGSSMGIAGCSAYGSHIALVATASIGPDQRPEVSKLVAAVDCGRVVNSGVATQQIEAGLLWALAQSVMPAPQWVGGFAKAGPSGLPGIARTPDVVVRFLPGSDSPGGLSGLGTLPLAPAVANAIHAAAGKRMRALPFDAMAA